MSSAKTMNVYGRLSAMRTMASIFLEAYSGGSDAADRVEARKGLVATDKRLLSRKRCSVKIGMMGKSLLLES
jgi:hypothetical protein